MTVALKRIYEPVTDEDGFRVLVDQLWPRGVSKEDATIHLWLKEAGPSTALRKWFNHEPEKWDTFKSRYFSELDASLENLAPLFAALEKGHVTLVYASRDQEHNQAVALKEYLDAHGH